MNQISIPNNVITMTSMEIVDVINELREDDAAEMLHKNFMVKLEKHPGIDSAKFLAQYKDSTGRTLKCYRLPKRESELMVMSESLAVQARVYDRMTELEVKQVQPVALSKMDILKLAMESEEGRLAAVAQLAIAKPKVDALDLIATADGMLNLQAAGKALQQKPNKFIQWMRENDWIYKRAGSTNNCARAEKFNAGYLTTKAHAVIQPDGTERVREQVMVTPKGLAKLAGLFSFSGV
jgi:anti-repressor protein